MIYRTATMNDAKNLLKWKNQADTRKFTIATHDKIKMSDHLKWLKDNLDSNYIIGDNLGTVRLHDNEIAIRIDTKHQGKGIAEQAIKHFRRGAMTAKIVEGNIKSMRLFIKCGFKPISYQKGYYVYQY